MQLARIKPYDRKRAHVVRRYTVGGVRYEESRGWYRVSDAQAAVLKKACHRPPGCMEPVDIFDVGSEEMAQAIESQETKQAEERAGVSEPNVVDVSDRTPAPSPDLTTADLPAAPPEAKPKGRKAGRRRSG